MEPRASVGVADVMATATDGLATEASVHELRATTEASVLEVRAELARLEGKLDASISELRADLYRALWLQGAAIVGATAAIITIVRVLG